MKKNSPHTIRIAITTLGCKVNQYESASFASGLAARGAELVDFSQSAEVYVVNTCAVTAKAGAQSRQMIRRALRANPGARVIVTGCYAQIASQQILEMSEQPVCIVGNGQKHLLVEVALSAESCDLEMYVGDISRQRCFHPLPVRRFPGRTRAYLKVQDGCDRFCSYCIVPYSRGRSRSLAPEVVLAQAGLLVEEGYRELVVTGIHVGHYGQDLQPPLRFHELLAMLDRQGRGVRYRISSLEPLEVSFEVLELLSASQNFMPHLHIPLQSGDDTVLQKMNRPYNGSEYVRVVEECLHKLPEAAIGVDVLVGFPGEDDRAFLQTVALLEHLPVAYLHVFPYSKRPGTLAASMAGQVPKKVKEERVAVLRELDHKKRIDFYRRQLGQVRRVLLEGPAYRAGLYRGFTENYVPVFCRVPEHLQHRVVEVRLDRLAEKGVEGTLMAELD